MTPADPPLLEAEDLSISLRTRSGRRTAVAGVCFAVRAGEVLGIAGESGSGKTLTALSALGLLPSGARTGGRLRLDGRDLLPLSSAELRAVRGRQVAMVFQDPTTALHPMLTVEVQLTEHLRSHLGLSRQQARERALELLRSVRIPDPERALRAHPGEFSGGMRQRIAIAIALACEPRLLLADEPTTALDVTVQAGILRLLDGLRRERGLGIVLITHDLGILSSLADRLCVMYAGRVVESGPTSAVLAAPRHPYTRGLLDALPHPDRSGAALVPIPGSPPPLGGAPSGCAYRTRCPYAQDRCADAVPPLVRAPDAAQEHACVVDPFRPAAAGRSRA